ncbi:STAS domain-containing protein [Umezawaea sp. Da 62-37]|uniref:STAS domain-containing protein n=1 Tax=Umezawaea sp. Da 62-37 TaxID=3075927 RepID=UPI0028F6F2F8|nr:STAS domain-containing protein [Umezawaea sp. Da 62-37]WNV83939.1 STAS domain-containing protein [Umezawaea sp. Da 62-37]
MDEQTTIPPRAAPSEVEGAAPAVTGIPAQPDAATGGQRGPDGTDPPPPTDSRGAPGAERSALQVHCGFRTNAVVVTATGELDVDTVPDLERRLVAALDAATAPTAPTLVVVDLTGVSHLDSRGLNMLVRCNDLGRRLGVPLHVAACTRRVLRTIVATALDEVLELYPSLDEALATSVT